LDQRTELGLLLSSWYASLPRSGGRSQVLAIRPPLDSQEAEDFLGGLRKGLFSVDLDGYVQSQFLPPSPDRQKILQLFWRTEGGRSLFREGVCQLAAVSALVLRHGWPQASVRLEPNASDVGEVAYGVDIIVRGSVNTQVCLCGEAKRSARELQRMLDQLQQCLREGQHSKSVCKRTNHPKAEALWKLRPAWFWAVCPGKDLVFRLQHDGENLELESAPRIPQGPN